VVAERRVTNNISETYTNVLTVHKCVKVLALTHKTEQQNLLSKENNPYSGPEKHWVEKKTGRLKKHLKSQCRTAHDSLQFNDSNESRWKRTNSARFGSITSARFGTIPGTNQTKHQLVSLTIGAITNTIKYLLWLYSFLTPPPPHSKYV